MKAELDLAPAHRFRRGFFLQLVSAPVPDHHRASAVLALGDQALEVVVVGGVIFDVGGQPPLGWIEGWPFGDRPGDEYAFHLQPEVVVQPGGPMLLDHEALVAAGNLSAGGLGRPGKITLALVFLE